jgi:hypothetical protein
MKRLIQMSLVSAGAGLASIGASAAPLTPPAAPAEAATRAEHVQHHHRRYHRHHHHRHHRHYGWRPGYYAYGNYGYPYYRDRYYYGGPGVTFGVPGIGLYLGPRHRHYLW